MRSAAGRPSRTQALRARDRGLRRISLATRSLVAVAVGATGLFSAIAARAQTGHARVLRASARGAGSAARVPAAPLATPTTQFADPGQAVPTTLAPPPTLPASGYQYDPAPVVVSGAT